MKINLAKINFINVIMYIFLSLFILPAKFRNILSAFFCLITMLIFIRNTAKIKPKNAVLLYIITSAVMIYIVINILYNNEINNLISSVIFMYVSYILFANIDYFKNVQKENKIIYIFLLIWLVLFLIYQVRLQGFNNYKFFFPSIGDKNFTAVAIFLLLCYSIKNNFKTGIIISIIYTLMLKSRLIYLVILIYIGINYLINSKKKNKNQPKVVTPFKIFLIFIIGTLATIGLSYYITYKIPKYKITNYRESIIDISNAIRFRSNVFAIEHIKNNKKILLIGYDNNLLKILGISNDINTTRYLGYAIVQPHNYMINSFLKLGVVFTLIYTYCISVLISKHWTNENIPIIISYIIINMFMHSLLSTNFLIFFMFVLACEKKEGNLHE